MHSFKDSANRDWIVSLNVDAIKRVKALLQIDLTKPTEGDPPLLIRLGIDVILLCDVLYAVCKPDCDQRSITDEQFGQAMGGDALLHGQRALLGELADFFHRLGHRQIKLMVEMQQKLIDATIAEAEKQVNAIDIDAVVQTEMRKIKSPSTPGNSSTPAPASLV